MSAWRCRAGLPAEAGSAQTGPGPPGLGRQRPGGGVLSQSPAHLGYVLRFILLIKFFPNWTILGFLPWWICFPCGYWQRFFLILKPFPSDSKWTWNRNIGADSVLLCIIKLSGLYLVFLLNNCYFILFYFLFWKGCSYFCAHMAQN